MIDWDFRNEIGIDHASDPPSMLNILATEGILTRWTNNAPRSPNRTLEFMQATAKCVVSFS